jgi:hypothetical protein
MISLHPCWDGDQWKTTGSSITVINVMRNVKSHLLPHLRNWKMFSYIVWMLHTTQTLVQSTLDNPRYIIFFKSCLTKIKTSCSTYLLYSVNNILWWGGRNLLTSLTSHYTSKHTTRGKTNPVFSTLLSYSGTGDTTTPDHWARMSRAHKFSKNQASTSKF